MKYSKESCQKILEEPLMTREDIETMYHFFTSHMIDSIYLRERETALFYRRVALKGLKNCPYK